MKSSTSKKAISKNKVPAKVSKSVSSASIHDLQELFLAELKDIYWAEKALVKAVPKMIRNASNEELKFILQNHLTETQDQSNRIESVFESIGQKVQAKKCEAMVGLIKELDNLIKMTKTGVVRDACIISTVQKIEHYEIASYGTLVAFATTLKYSKAIEILQAILMQEKNADSKLSELAQASINMKAERADGIEHDARTLQGNANSRKTSSQ
jgi:ferritin-like metal-binding protein YciE